MKIRYQILTGVLTGMTVGAMCWGLKIKDNHQQKELKEIHWTPYVLEQWVNPSLSNKPTYKIVLGLRRDGTCVWKEVIEDDQRESRVQFETPDGKDQEVVISHVGAVKFLPPKK